MYNFFINGITIPAFDAEDAIHQWQHLGVDSESKIWDFRDATGQRVALPTLA